MMLQGIRSAFGSENYRLLIGCPPSYEPDVIERAEIEFLRSLRENPNIAGAIIWDTGNPGSRNAYRSLVDAGVPLVFIDREPPFEIAADVVATNNRRAARNAVRHLIDLGHERIAMVLGEDRASSVLDRIEGYRSALSEARIDPRPHWVVELPIGPLEPRAVQVAERALVEILAGPESPTALFAVNDRIALYLFEAAKNLRIRVPERFSLVGFDWLMRWLPSGGDLTTVSQPFDEIGRTAAQRLLTRIGSGAVETPRLILLDAPLVIKSSTGVPFATSSSLRKTQFIGESHASSTPASVHTY
jgi:LacI family transcriptional regulator